MPQTMLALTLRESGLATAAQPTQPGRQALAPFLEAKRIDVPRPGPGQVLVRVGLASVNPSDRVFVAGRYGQARVAGRPAGFEGMGMVVDAGGGLLARALVGRRVAFAVTPDGSGAWAEVACTQASACIPLRDDVGDEDGATLIVNPLTAAALFDRLRRSGSQSFVLNAAGSQLGKLLMGLASERGHRPIALVRREAALDAVRALGASHAFCTGDPDLPAQLARRFHVENTLTFLDAVVDVHSAITFEAMPSRARWIIYGVLAEEPARLTGAGQLIFMRKHIEGFWLADWMRRTSLPRKLATVRAVQQRFASGRWRTDVSAIIPLAEAVEALPDALEAGEGKVLIRP